MEDIVIIGGGGHAQSVADSILSEGKYNILGYTDKEDRYLSLTYLGNDEVLESLYRNGVHNVFIGLGYLGNADLRDVIYNRIKNIGFNLPTIIDPSAVVSTKSTISEGTFIGKNACVNIGAQIGKMCIINSSSVIEHNCIVDEFTHIAIGACLCGNVSIHDHVFVGANSTVIQGVCVNSYSIIGAASVVLHDVKERSIVYGVV